MHSVPLYKARNLARNKYKKCIFNKRSDSKKSVTDNLQASLVDVSKNKFWRLWKSNFKNSGNKLRAIKKANSLLLMTFLTLCLSSCDEAKLLDELLTFRC